MIGMKRRSGMISTSILLQISLTVGVPSARTPDCSTCHLDGSRNALPPIRSIQAEGDRGYGVMDKGSVANITGNFGILSSYHVFFQYAMHWPSWADETHQYCFGFGPIAAVQDNVVESITQFAGVDWEAKDGGFGTQFSGDVRAASDETPFLASSDIRDTWPRIGDERVWPGPFRFNLNTPDPYDQVAGEFASDRDIFGVYDDSDNLVQPLGIEVTQMSYSYNRSYAEDFVFFDLCFKNVSSTIYDSIYIGHYGDFRVDYDNQDLIRFMDSDNDGGLDFLYYWDVNGEITEPWVVMGMVGVALLHTPENLGATDFHYFLHEVRPGNDAGLWPLISGQPELMQQRGLNPADFFHGQNPRFDDPDDVSAFYPEGAPLDYFMMTKVYDFAPGDSVRLSLAVVMGSNEEELFANLAMAQQMADRGFQGSGPPLPPLLSAKPGDHKVTLYWSREPSESSTDVITGEQDFEGYKIYRSQNQGQSWGTEVRDYNGILQGYVPLAVFDLENGIKGIDPAAPWQSLGNDSGLQYSFTDSGLVNGIEYWYAVCAYDRGLQDTIIVADTLTGESHVILNFDPSLQNGFGRPEVSTHIIAVTPGVTSQTYSPFPGGLILDPVFGVISEGYVAPSGPLTLGTAYVEVIYPDSITGHDYTIAIHDSLPHPDSSMVIQGQDTIWNYFTSFWDSTTYSVIDLTTGIPLIEYQPFYQENESGFPLVQKPIADGLRFTVTDGSVWFGWTLFHEDSCTFDWWREKRTSPVGEATLIGTASFRLTVDYSAQTMDSVADEFGGFYPPINVPFTVEMISDTANPIDVSNLCWIIDYETGVLGGTVPFPPNTFFSPAGWDLIPGGAGYNPHPNGLGTFGDSYPDEISFRYYSPEGDTSIVNIRTQNLPDSLGGIAPSQGDQFTILNARLTSKNRFDFSTSAPSYTVNQQDVDLAKIKVVPNPYIVTAGWETSADDHRLQFIHLPPQCTIEIYTVSGSLVKTLHHQSDTVGYLFWDLRNESKQDIAFGLYIYHVKTPEGKEYVNRFVVIR